MFHKSHSRGQTWDYFGMPGLSMELLNNSKAGSSLKNIFRLGIINEMANVKEDSTTDEIKPTTVNTNTLSHANPTSPSNTNSHTCTSTTITNNFITNNTNTSSTNTKNVNTDSTHDKNTSGAGTNIAVRIHSPNTVPKKNVVLIKPGKYALIWPHFLVN